MSAVGVLGALLVAFFALPAFAQVGLNVDVESAVRAEFADAPVMIEIARCESKFRQYTDAGNPLYGGYQGRMVGIFQVYSDIHDSYAASRGMDIETVAGNIAYARHLYESEGTRPWNSSMACWGSAQTAAPLTASVTTSSELTMDLSTGMDHPQVRILQQKLNGSGFVITESGPGSPGNETTLYGALTRAAVQRFQCAKEIVCSGDGFSSGYGVFGPRTRAALLGTQQTSTSPVLTSPETTPATSSSEIPSPPVPTAAGNEEELIAQLQAQIAELQAQLAALLARNR